MSDPITPVAALGIAVVYLAKTVYEYIKPKNGNYNGSRCVLSNPDIVKLRNIEIGNHVIETLEPNLKEQIELLREIRDTLRDQERR